MGGDASPDPSRIGRDVGARSLTASVYQRVRADIVASRLRQNEKLHLATLKDQFGVSLSVVREALSRLVADGLVIAEDQRGFRVSPISRADLIDVTRTRIGIESMALEQAMQAAGPGWTDRVDVAYFHMAEVARTLDVETWTDAHTEFHRTLLEPCESAWLIRLRDMLYEQSERYRLASVDPISMPTVEAIELEHRALRDAVVNHRVDQAKRAIEAHFVATMNRVLAGMPPPDTPA